MTASAERFQSANSRRRLFSGGSVPASPCSGTPAVTTTVSESSEATESRDQNVEPLPTPSPLEKVDNKPKRTGSVEIFFRKVFFVFFLGGGA